MKRVQLLALITAASVMVSACGEATLAEETAAVGSPCPWVAGGFLSGVPCSGEVGRDPHDAVYALSESQLHIAMCDATSIGGGDVAGRLHLKVTDPTIGTHPIAAEEASAYFYLDPPGCYSCSGYTGVSGSVTIDGYDPVSHAVCGTFDIEVQGDGSTTTRSQEGVFVAIIP